MIGIIPKAGQTRVIEEFFELFKTPWELYRSGQVYDVVIASADEIPEVLSGERTRPRHIIDAFNAKAKPDYPTVFD